MKKNRWVSLLLCLAILFSLAATASADTTIINHIIGDNNTVVFKDVSDNHWAKETIDYFVEQGIVNGFEDGTFKPEDGVTREQFCKLLIATFNQPLSTPDTPTFADVKEDRWSYPYIEVCKDFLTGYANPFGGMPTFHPAEYATREDIAVALVRMMGYTDKDASNANYARYHFSDGSKISPNLLPYVSIACEKSLISGYPDGTFRPDRGITRAETVVLLNRATKQAVANIGAELEMTAEVKYSSDRKTATIHITAESGTTVTVNGESVKMEESFRYYLYSNDGTDTGDYVYKFAEEGSKDFEIIGKHAGKTKTINLTAKYEVGVPTLKVDQTSQTVTGKTFKLSGTAKDDIERVTVTINGTATTVYYDGSWWKEITLSEGKNVFTVVATNESGKQTEKSITVTYEVGAPMLKIDQTSQTVTSKAFKLSGTAKDDNYKTTVTINGKATTVYYDGSWWKEIILSEGENVFTVVATNENDKKTEKSITVTYEVGAPTLKINQSSQTVTSKAFKLSGTAKDDNYNVTVTINGKDSTVYYDGSWWKDITLSEGENVFTVVATNENGKQTEKSITVTYEVGAPTLKIDQTSQTVTSKTFKLSGTAKDDNYKATVTINGTATTVYYDGSWWKEITLSEGENVFTVAATNEIGKQTEKTITVTYTPPAEESEPEA